MDDKTRQVLDQVMGAGCGFCGFLFTSPFHAQRCGGPNVIEIRNQALEEAAKTQRYARPHRAISCQDIGGSCDRE
jgi:hypothetical protein